MKRLAPCDVIRAPKPAPERTVVVLGMPSGGTSMVAGSIRLLGVAMGENYDDANQEDLEFLDLVGSLQPLHNGMGMPIESKFDQIRALVARRNEAHAVWGWKDPHSRHYIRELLPSLRNPHVILIFRDNHAAAQRIHFRTKRDHLSTITEYLEHMRSLVEFVRGGSFPLMLVSYERAVRMSEEFAAGLNDFVGAGASEDALRKVARYVRPERGGGNVAERFLESDEARWREQNKEAKAR
ncbi:hypothetical protein [Limibacillus halophilus]|jgi:hypothetical protein